MPVYPSLVRVPGYPVYYAPQVNSNYFFYDGMYWVYQADNWYASSWYNGPWELVDPEAVPLFILRVPVRYYRQPPAYFHGWRSDAPPRWGDHWGNRWEQRRQRLGTVESQRVPRPPRCLHTSGNIRESISAGAQQQALESRNYHYQPRDAVVQQRYQAQQAQSAPAASPPVRQAAPHPQARSPQQGQRASSPPHSLQQAAPAAPRAQPQRTGGANVQRPAAANNPIQPARPAAHPQVRQQQARQPQMRQQQAPKPQGQVMRAPQPPKAQPQARQQQAPKPQGQVMRAPQPPKAQPQARQPQRGAPQHQQPAPKAKGQDKGPQGNGPAKKPAQGQQ